jgi:cytochrome c biogenesis protein CcdA/thiol-disulfide isomerase/thioredoxin
MTFSMTFLLISFVAGILTVLAPCVLPLLPVIIGGSVSNVRSRLKPYIITTSLTVSVVVFTLLLKFLTIFIDIPPMFWQYLSGGILIFFGLITLFPFVWEKMSIKFNLVLGRKSNTLLAEGVKKESFVGDIIIGASLGPVFSSCSPTYFVILATVLPQSFATGLIYLIAYSIGLSLALLLIAKIGQRLVSKLDGVSDPEGWFKRTLGAIFLFVGIFVATGLDKNFQTFLISKNIFDITVIEQNFLLPNVLDEKFEDMDNNKNADEIIATGSKVKGNPMTIIAKKLKYPMYKEITNPKGFVNSEPFQIKDLIGKKIILLDVMTYSCINCQRTFPYANAWYAKYKDQGLEIVGIHTPEFAFEKKKENVIEAMRKFGIKFPVVMDNDYGTWNAYGNNYWPRKYLIDIDGFVVYDHIGEGNYDETENVIKLALKERAERMGTDSKSISGSVSGTIKAESTVAKSNETYFGAHRNSQFFGNGDVGKIYSDNFTLPKTFPFNQFFLGGKWKIENEYIESEGDAILAFNYEATKVHLVAEAPNGATIKIQNGDVTNNTKIQIKDATLYTIVNNPKSQNSVFYINVSKGVRLYALTFS